MKDDYLYCYHCEKVSIDVYTIYDTRIDTKFLPPCPHCGAHKLMNASQWIETKAGRWKGGLKNKLVKLIREHQQIVELKGKPNFESMETVGF